MDILFIEGGKASTNSDLTDLINSGLEIIIAPILVKRKVYPEYQGF